MQKRSNDSTETLSIFAIFNLWQVKIKINMLIIFNFYSLKRTVKKMLVCFDLFYFDHSHSENTSLEIHEKVLLCVFIMFSLSASSRSSVQGT